MPTLPNLQAPIADTCDAAAAETIYLLTAQNVLSQFDPTALTDTAIGDVHCPTTSAPFSMAANGRGDAYALFTDGALFHIDTSNARCNPTSFAPDQHGFQTFGMGFLSLSYTNATLFVDQAQAFATGANALSAGLATMDTSTWTLSFVAPLEPRIRGAELTGIGHRLFGFYTNLNAVGSRIVEIDPLAGRILAGNGLDVGAPNDGYALASAYGHFLVFTEDGGPTTVTRYDPDTLAETTVATLPGSVVGASSVPCP